MVILENSALNNIDGGLNNLTSVGGSLSIQANSIAHLDGLNNLTSIGGDLDIVQNSFLDNIGGFNGLTQLEATY
jgi:hypothetical protein